MNKFNTNDMADPSIQFTILSMLPLQGNFPYNDANDEEQYHQGK